MEFGERATVYWRLTRRSKYNRERVSRLEKRWEETTIPGGKLVSVIGKRTLSNGYVIPDYESGDQYTATEHFTAYLVVANMRENPFYVRLPQIEPGVA